MALTDFQHALSPFEGRRPTQRILEGGDRVQEFDPAASRLLRPDGLVQRLGNDSRHRRI